MSTALPHLGHFVADCMKLTDILKSFFTAKMFFCGKKALSVTVRALGSKPCARKALTKQCPESNKELSGHSKQHGF